jgi:hypothetical protein
MPEDLKYGHVTVERGDIGEDEPVVVFRAQDALLPELLRLYRDLCKSTGSPQRHLVGVTASRARVVEWQRDHFTQVPQSNPRTEEDIRG